MVQPHGTKTAACCPGTGSLSRAAWGKGTSQQRRVRHNPMTTPCKHRTPRERCNAWAIVLGCRATTASSLHVGGHAGRCLRVEQLELLLQNGHHVLLGGCELAVSDGSAVQRLDGHDRRLVLGVTNKLVLPALDDQGRVVCRLNRCDGGLELDADLQRGCSDTAEAVPCETPAVFNVAGSRHGTGAVTYTVGGHAAAPQAALP